MVTLTNEKIRKAVSKIYGVDNIRKMFVSFRSGQFWVSVHLYADRSDELLVSNEDDGKLWRRFGRMYQNYRHQYGAPKRISFSIDPNLRKMK